MTSIQGKPHDTPAEHIVLVISSLGPGGAERVAADLAAYLSGRGRRVTLLTLNGNDIDYYGLPSSVNRLRIETRRKARWIIDTVRFAFWRSILLRKTLRAQEPDVVISFLEQTNVRVALSLLGTGIPLIVSERVHPEHHPISRGWSVARYLTYRLAHAVVVQTSEVAEWFKKSVPTRHLYVIPNAVREERFFGCGHCRAQEHTLEPQIIAIGRLAPQKGFDLLIDAFKLSGLAEIGWRLSILGEGAERRPLESLIAKNGLSGSVVLPGHQTEVGSYLAGASMFVLSSRYEGFPNALLEAMQAGCACISFACPSGPRDLIETMRTGLLVPVGDVEALANGMRRLAEDAPLRHRLGQAAQLSVNTRFNRDVIYGQWLAVIDHIVGRSRENTTGENNDV